jgi:hypothetical protein
MALHHGLDWLRNLHSVFLALDWSTKIFAETLGCGPRAICWVDQEVSMRIGGIPKVLVALVLDWLLLLTAFSFDSR